jgi:pyridoxamine 5'-phosphate oxidase
VADARERPLRRADLDPDPLRQFARWFGQAPEAAPEAMAVATATPDGAPSVRMVLMKGFDERGFVFFTNYESRKALELAANPRAALLFHWLGRQVRIEGRVERTSREESVAYARSRPRGSQLSALASPQSRPIAGRSELERRVAELAHEHPSGDLPEHPAWGGFRVIPESYEFWEHRPDRLHDRVRFRRGPGGAWIVERLAP